MTYGRRNLFTALLGVLGLVVAGWSGFLWWQLLRSRDGFDAYCVGGGGCSALWDGSFAGAVHQYTGLPVAAWGVVWGLVAAWTAGWVFFSLKADEEELGEAVGRRFSALGWVALSGIVGVVGLAVVVARAGEFCGNCAIAYALILAWCGLAGWVLRDSVLRDSGARLSFDTLGAPVLAGAVLWVALLWPGLATPKSSVGESLLAASTASSATTGEAGDAHAGHDHGAEGETDPHAGHDHGPREVPMDALAGLRVEQWPLDDETIRQRLATLGGLLEPRAREQVGGLFEQIAASTPAVQDPPAPRALHGPADAPVRITEFTDTLCGHCAQLFLELEALDELLPDAAFAVDSRHFPLDRRCNPEIPSGEMEGRCAGALARVCFEGEPGRFEYEELLYRNQESLTSATILDFASPWMPIDQLRACMESPETMAKVHQDARYAGAYAPRGTPLVLVNGRQVPPFLPALYALILTGGDADHPALEAIWEAP